MRITLTSIMVDDQAKALAFYTDVLGFKKELDIPVGEYRWITVSSETKGVQLALEPNVNPAGKAFQQAMFEQGIPLTAFQSDELEAEVARLKARGVVFTQGPMNVGPVSIAVFADTCGNLIQLFQPSA